MNEQDFAVALFALFMTGYVLIRLIFAVPRTSGYVDPEDADVDTTYHYNEDGEYEPDWEQFDRVSGDNFYSEIGAISSREISCGACTCAIGAHSYDVRCAK